ncbi:hypothetical protein VSVS12_03901 [Vibrio scophthalmi]|uniref:hypothetical protein n=1 Tax=Vibrio scophthalmi TaxID=45658 RepID=UPI00080974BC|nr:hypothetical protein [Vibrio scophthalmi]ANS87601.1 hypothetical protein VSVS12_03901 [Vibrio scophthalmi]
METIIVNNDLTIKSTDASLMLTHENKSCEGAVLSLSDVRELLNDASSINLFLSSGAVTDLALVSSLNEQLRDKLESAQSALTYLDYFSLPSEH